MGEFSAFFNTKHSSNAKHHTNIYKPLT